MTINCLHLFQNDFKVFIPELFLITVFNYLLMYGVIVSPSIYNKQTLIIKEMTWLVIYSFVLGLMILLNNPFTGWILFNNLLIVDTFSSSIKAVLITTTIITLLISLNYIKYEKLNAFEYVLLIQLATFGMLLLVSSYDLVSLYLAIELVSLTLYIIATFKRNSEYSTEAGLKYFILGAFSSGLLLFGCSILYGFTGITNFEEFNKLFSNLGLFRLVTSSSTWFDPNTGPEALTYIVNSNGGLILGLIFIMSAFLFKLTVVPFHMWAPDVYEGSATPVTAYFTIVPKIALLGIFLRLLLYTFYDLIQPWQPIIILCSISSMVLATFGAFYQTKLKRLLIYSSIGHIGYMLIGLSTGTIEGIQSVFVYIIIYIIMSIAMFTIILNLRQQASLSRLKFISDLNALSKSSPILAITLALILFSMAGIPPLAGFCSKLYVFFAAIDAELYALAIIGVLTSTLGCFYYIRLIKIMYFEKSDKVVLYKTFGKLESMILGFALFFIIFFFMSPSPLLILSHNLALDLLL